MKKCWITRIDKLERASKSIHAELYFEEWIAQHAINPSQDYWELLEIVPEDLRLHCIFHILDKIRNDQPLESSNSGCKKNLLLHENRSNADNQTLKI